MGIFSFGKKDDAPSRRGANSSSSKATRGERVERRTRRTERSSDADAMLLDPTLPEKQRARRRLVGAIALVVAAVVVLPMVLDSHPKPVTDDISIDIPARPAPKASASPEDTQAGVAPDNPPAATALAASGLAPAGMKPDTAAKVSEVPAAPVTKQAATPDTKATVAAKPARPEAPVVAANSAPQTKPATKPAQPAEAVPQTAAAADADSGTPAAPPGNRFAVQLGSFPDDASAHSWATKLKAAGVPAYTERRKQSDGSMRTLLRAGPFADRAAASAAIAKVREAGLTSGANNGAAQ
ncbi:SPOR domain-containing protein [Paraburkholderia saeva]|uniref:SPOR domain-containing protein n=1 Tax=Paraburkholderia saeva TaxID=2777537 RepID=UPI001DDEEB46|nr:SPOR domain-containing protein [Paraburkholderia saeva]CAG4908028.1 Cell division protein DedD [Paraburkholderia saeva]